jgi:exodeoxyribonuclease VII small subunit
METNDEINYSHSFEELQKIVEEIEDGKITIDDLSQKVKRAAKLIKLMKAKLQNTEDEINKILKEI